MSTGQMVRKTIRITPGQEDEIEAAVARGEYPNDSEAIRAAIREKFQEEEPDAVPIVLEGPRRAGVRR